jgi:hypothetical protein
MCEKVAPSIESGKEHRPSLSNMQTNSLITIKLLANISRPLRTLRASKHFKLTIY